LIRILIGSAGLKQKCYDNRVKCVYIVFFFIAVVTIYGSYIKVKVKLSRYRPGQALGVSEG
jgi:hypothetical protein